MTKFNENIWNIFECLSNEICSDLYADDLIIIADSGGMHQADLDMKRSHGGEGVESKCRKDKGHDQRYRPGHSAEFPCAVCHT